MGFRVRKSFKVMPGVRMTVTPHGMSVSAGVKGARISANTRGRVTRTLSIPGTGISHTSTLSSGARSAPARPERSTPAPAPSAPKAGMFAPRWEKDLVKVVQSGGADAATFARIGADPGATKLAALYEVLLGAFPAKAWDRARALLNYLYDDGFRPKEDLFVRKYTPGGTIGFAVAAGITTELPLTRDALALLLAELEQDAGHRDRAIAVVESLEPTTIAAVSLAELYAEERRWAEVVAMTDGLSNEDDASTFLLVQRGAALREQGYYEAARESLKEALRVRSRSSEIRQLANIERGKTYLAEGKKAMARKDFERVMAENSTFEGLADLISQAS